MAPPKQELCTRGHQIGDDPYVYPNGYRACRRCRQIWKRAQNAKIKARHEAERQARREARAPTLPELHGLSRRQLAARRTWAVRRARYGPPGVHPDKMASLKEHGRQMIRYARLTPQPVRTTCRRGHALIPSNVWVSVFLDKPTGRWYRQRACKTCARLRRHNRPAWIVHHGVRVSVLAHDRYVRRTMRALTRAVIASHPDKGGSLAKFVAARREQQAFRERHMHWYDEHGVPWPGATRTTRKDDDAMSKLQDGRRNGVGWVALFLLALWPTLVSAQANPCQASVTTLVTNPTLIAAELPEFDALGLDGQPLVTAYEVRTFVQGASADQAHVQTTTLPKAAWSASATAGCYVAPMPATPIGINITYVSRLLAKTASGQMSAFSEPSNPFGWAGGPTRPGAVRVR